MNLEKLAQSLAERFKTKVEEIYEGDELSDAGFSLKNGLGLQDSNYQENRYVLQIFSNGYLMDIKSYKSLNNIIEDKDLENLYIKAMIEVYKENIGKKVKKKTDLPFKSTFRKNTVKDVVEHEYVKNKIAYTFEEDNSQVEVGVCELIK